MAKLRSPLVARWEGPTAAESQSSTGWSRGLGNACESLHRYAAPGLTSSASGRSSVSRWRKKKLAGAEQGTEDAEMPVSDCSITWVGR